jgi:PAS domain S-box-containing protein
MNYTDRNVTAIVTWMTAIMAGLVGLVVPLAYFLLSYSYQDAALQTEAEINARIVTQLINANPEMWRFEELRLMELTRRRPGKGIPEVRRIRGVDNAVIAESSQKLPWPVQTRVSELKDAGRTVGTLEISRSLLPLLGKTGLLTLVGILLGFFGFVVLRIVPLRLLNDALRSLFAEKERAHVTLRSIGDGVITTDAQGNVTLLNSVAEKLTGWKQDEAAGKHLSEVFHIVNEHTRAVCENPVDVVLREKRTTELANGTILIARDGTERVIADSGAPIRGQDGRIIGVVLVFRDVTDKQKRAEEMQRAAKLESVGLLAGGIAHDFNNILTAIMGNVSLAMLNLEPENKTLPLLSNAETACLRAKDLTFQLLTFAKGGTPVKETLCLGELIRSSSDFALTGSNVRADISIEKDIPAVNVDGGQINQVLNNLVLNAVEAMPDGGVVTIRAERALLTGDDFPLPGGAYVRISVEDRGAGIPREILPRIFDPYFTTKRSGTGLGLATCYSIIKKHGGHITALSQPGKGAAFHFYLPASSSSAPVKKEEQATALFHGKGRILVMDDEEAIRTIAGAMLSRLGYEAVFAKHGTEAIELYRNALHSERFDALILDLTIPGGMGGKETVQKLIELDPGVKAIVSSGYSENPVLSDFGKYGFRGVIGKPYDVKQMSRVLHQVIGNNNLVS